jgi:orotate phosphoribosyltransferase
VDSSPEEKSKGFFDTNVIFDTNALFDSGCIQFGAFTLKSGLPSPIRMNLRRLTSHPRLLRQVARSMAGIARPLAFDHIVITPYANQSIGVALALELNRPLLQMRRDAGAHGPHHDIEGIFKKGDTALLVDDLLIRGGSKLKTIATLKNAGLNVHDVLVLIDWEQGGAANLAQQGYTLHAVLHLTSVLDVLQKSGRITHTQHAEVLAYLDNA